MITNALLGILIGFLNWIVSLLSQQADVPAMTTLTSSVATASQYFTAMNSFFPFEVLFSVIVIDLVFEGIYFVYKLIRWGYIKVPGIN